MPDDRAMQKPKTFDRDSVGNTLTVAIGLSLICSILVASTAIVLKPKQERNEREFRERIIVDVAGVMEPGMNLEDALAHIEPRMIDLASGEYVDSPDVDTFDAAAAANNPDTSIAIPSDRDIANIRRRATVSPVYLVRQHDEVEQIILPVYGSGLWSTLYGYLALSKDGETVTGLQFYSHAETPGLGDQIDKPEWRALWPGKRLYDEDGRPSIEVIRGVVQTGSQNPDARYQVDGLSGATLTGRGVTNLIRYWTGPDGFGPYLQKYWLAKGS